MKNTSISKKISTSMVAALALIGCSAATQSIAEPAPTATNMEQAYFVDILHLKKGKTAEDAKAYFDLVEPIIATHGLVRIEPAFIVTKGMKGDTKADLVNMWTVSDPENTFDNIFNDPNYKQHIPTRNATFDMSKSHMFMMAPAGY